MSVVCGLLCGLGLASGAQAQLVAPRVVALPDITVPVGVAVPPSGRVEVVVVIRADSTVSVEQCDASEALCALVDAALAGAALAPATRDGAPIDARIRIALRLHAEVDLGVEESMDGGVAQPTVDVDAGDGGTAQPPDAGVSDGGSRVARARPPVFAARARAIPTDDPGRRRLQLSETRDLPGAFGDPFRAVDALPGIVPVASGLPYFYVRGAPPAGTLYLYDDIPMPTLYHLGIGPAVIHPRMVGPIQLYSGAAPARYGRHTGGVIVGEGPSAPDGEVHGEAELRLLDVSGYVQAPLVGGTVSAAARYGYPGLILSLLVPEVTLAYWDYQLRYTTDTTRADRFELIALGSYDSFETLGDADSRGNTTRIQFHRFEPRYIHRLARGEFGIAFTIGWEQSVLGESFQLEATRIGPRVWLEHRLSRSARLRLSGDLIGVSGAFTQTQPEGSPPPSARNAADIPGRTMWGIQAELNWRLSPLVELRLGARADAWLQGGGAMAVIDPRARLILHFSETFDLHGAIGVTHQPAVFFIPLPGIQDLATSRGLQSATQAELGFGWDTPLDLRLELQAFFHEYRGLVFTDTLLLDDAIGNICAGRECPPGLAVPNRIDGYSYGAELFIRRAPEHRLSGFLSYTLGRSHVDDVAGLPYTPSWDVRHVLNLVTQWNIGAGFSIGARLHARSGKLIGTFYVDDTGGLAREESRLPWFVRLDAQIAYSWQTSWGRLRLSFEWLNTTLAREPSELACSMDALSGACVNAYLPAIFFPNLGLRSDF